MKFEEWNKQYTAAAGWHCGTPEQERRIAWEAAMEQAKTTATLTTEYGSVTIVVNKTDMTLPEVFEELLEPLLLATGFSQGVIDDYLK